MTHAARRLHDPDDDPDARCLHDLCSLMEALGRLEAAISPARWDELSCG